MAGGDQGDGQVDGGSDDQGGFRCHLEVEVEDSGFEEGCASTLGVGIDQFECRGIGSDLRVGIDPEKRGEIDGRSVAKIEAVARVGKDIEGVGSSDVQSFGFGDQLEADDTAGQTVGSGAGAGMEQDP